MQPRAWPWYCNLRSAATATTSWRPPHSGCGGVSSFWSTGGPCNKQPRRRPAPKVMRPRILPSTSTTCQRAERTQQNAQPSRKYEAYATSGGNAFNASAQRICNIPQHTTPWAWQSHAPAAQNQGPTNVEQPLPPTRCDNIGTHACRKQFPWAPPDCDYFECQQMGGLQTIDIWRVRS